MLLSIRSSVLGNEADEKRKRYIYFIWIKYSQCLYENIRINTSKAIADRIDLGEILLNATSDDIADLTTAGWISKWGGLIPNQKLSIYKNRRGKYVNCYIWICADKGTCRFVPIGTTTWNLEPYDVPPLPLEALARTVREEKK